MSLRRIDPLLTESDHYNPKSVPVGSGIVMDKAYHGTPSSYEASKKFFRIFMAFKDRISSAFVDAVNLYKHLCLMLSWILSQNIVHSVFNDSSLSSFSCCDWNIVKRSRSKRRGRIDDDPLFITPLVSDSASFFASLCHRTQTLFPKYKLYYMKIDERSNEIILWRRWFIFSYDLGGRLSLPTYSLVVDLNVRPVGIDH